MVRDVFSWVEPLGRVSSPAFALLVRDLVLATRSGDEDAARLVLPRVVRDAPRDVQVPWLASRVLEALAAFGLETLAGVPARSVRALLGDAWPRALPGGAALEVADRLLADGYAGDVPTLVELSALLAPAPPRS